MQSSTENALELVAVGNAFLSGRDITGFWPDAPTFRWMKTCEFRIPPKSGQDADDYPLIAADPMEWFTKLKPWCKGLRLHSTRRPREPSQTLDTPDRMLAGFVGGGPRWLIELVGWGKTGADSELWEGFHRLGDRADPERRIWNVAYIVQGECATAEVISTTLDDVLPELKRVLPEIEAYARAEKHDTFAECFARASAALAPRAREPNEFLDALQRYSGMADAQINVLDAIMSAWVFGGMGSWNDVGGGGERYDELSEALYNALNSSIAGLANSTYRG